MIRKMLDCIRGWLQPKCRICRLPKVKVVDFAIDYRTGNPISIESYECPTSHGSKDGPV